MMQVGRSDILDAAPEDLGAAPQVHYPLRYRVILQNNRLLPASLFYQGYRAALRPRMGSGHTPLGYIPHPDRCPIILQTKSGTCVVMARSCRRHVRYCIRCEPRAGSISRSNRPSTRANGDRQPHSWDGGTPGPYRSLAHRSSTLHSTGARRACCVGTLGRRVRRAQFPSSHPPLSIEPGSDPAPGRPIQPRPARRTQPPAWPPPLGTTVPYPTCHQYQPASLPDPLHPIVRSTSSPVRPFQLGPATLTHYRLHPHHEYRTLPC